MLDYTIDCNNCLFPTVKQRVNVQSDNARRITGTNSELQLSCSGSSSAEGFHAYEYSHSIIRNICAIKIGKKSERNSGVIVSVALCYFQWLCKPLSHRMLFPRSLYPCQEAVSLLLRPSFWTGVYSSRKQLWTRRHEDRQVQVHHELRPEVCAGPPCVDGNRSISK